MNDAPLKDLQENEDDQASFERARPLLVSLHFVRTTLRRRLLVCVLAPIVGLLVAAGAMAAFPPPHAARATLVLTVDEQQDSSMSMDTNSSLLGSQTLGTRVVSQLGLAMTPQDFLGTVTVEQTGSQLMQLTLKAPSDAEAVRRLDVLTAQYLTFRGEQLTYQTQVLVGGLQEQIKQLQAESEELTTQINELSSDDRPSSSRLSDAISQRASVQSRIDALEQQLENSTLRNAAVVASSRILDQPTPEPGRALRTTLLGLVSGAIGGIAAGWGGVLFLAVTSSHLRRRADVAAAIGADVRSSVGRTNPLPASWSWVPGVSGLDGRRADQRELAASVIAEETVQPRRRTTLAVAGVDNGPALTFVVADAARELARGGYSVTVIDLTGSRGRGLRTLTSPAGAAGSIAVLRPRGLPALTRRLDDLLAAGLWDEGDATPEPDLAEVTLIATELQPATGAGYLAAWTDRTVLVMSTGRTSVEKARTVSDQVRAAGLELRFAVLLGTDSDDHSVGTAPTFVVRAPEAVVVGEVTDERAPRWAASL